MFTNMATARAFLLGKTNLGSPAAKKAFGSSPSFQASWVDELPQIVKGSTQCNTHVNASSTALTKGTIWVYDSIVNGIKLNHTNEHPT